MISYFGSVYPEVSRLRFISGFQHRIESVVIILMLGIISFITDILSLSRRMLGFRHRSSELLQVTTYNIATHNTCLSLSSWMMMISLAWLLGSIWFAAMLIIVSVFWATRVFQARISIFQECRCIAVRYASGIAAYIFCLHIFSSSFLYFIYFSDDTAFLHTVIMAHSSVRFWVGRWIPLHFISLLHARFRYYRARVSHAIVSSFIHSSRCHKQPFSRAHHYGDMPVIVCSITYLHFIEVSRLG